eukprot:757709-Hanusia_phi.AAC.1
MEDLKRYSGGFGGSMRQEALQDGSSEWVDGLDPGNIEVEGCSPAIEADRSQVMMHDPRLAGGSQAAALKK